jgi:hypothetical protein
MIVRTKVGGRPRYWFSRSYAFHVLGLDNVRLHRAFAGKVAVRRGGFCLLAIALLAAACTSSGTPTQSTCPTDSTLTYVNFGQSFLASNCLECHTTRDRPVLTTQADVLANLTLIDEQAAAGPAATNTNMPQDASMSVDERTLLGEWLACGAP